MTDLYSPSNNAFFNTADYEVSQIPSDVVELEDGYRESLYERAANEPGKILPREDGLPHFVPFVPTKASKETVCDNIDLAADAARRRFVSPGDLIEKEYEVALQQAKDWLAAGMPDPVPSAVQSGMAASNNTLTAEQAAREIVDMAAAWEGVLMATREIRLTGKAAVNAAADDADFDAVAQPYLDQLEAIRPQGED